MLTLHLLRGETAQTIAAERDCPSSTVRNQVMRGMDLLRRALPAGLAGAALDVFAEGRDAGCHSFMIDTNEPDPEARSFTHPDFVVAG